MTFILAGPIIDGMEEEATKRVETPSPSGWVDGPARAGFPPRSATPGTKGSLTLRLGPDGNLDLESMRPATAERLKQVLADPAFQAQFGVGPSVTGGVEVDPAFIESALDTLAAIQAQVVSYKYKIPYPQALSLLSYTKPEKAMLVPPAQRVLSKRAPEWVAKYGDEVTLVICLVQCARMKFAMAAQLSDKLKEEKKEAEPENGETDSQHLPAAAVAMQGVA